MAQSICSVAECGQPSRKRGWCASHYSQWYRTGEVRPFRYKWAAEGGDCVVCGDPVQGRRKHCSAACQAVDSRTRGKRPSEFTCRLCGKVVSFRARDANGRLVRTDAVWCRDCGRESPEAIRYKRYGITPERYAEALLQGCEICSDVVETLHVDHDHNCCHSRKYRLCGQCTRGFLCGNCNRALGLMRDDPDRLRSAIAYLTP